MLKKVSFLWFFSQILKKSRKKTVKSPKRALFSSIIKGKILLTVHRIPLIGRYRLYVTPPLNSVEKKRRNRTRFFFDTFFFSGNFLFLKSLVSKRFQVWFAQRSPVLMIRTQKSPIQPDFSPIFNPKFSDPLVTSHRGYENSTENSLNRWFFDKSLTEPCSNSQNTCKNAEKTMIFGM